MFSNFTDALIAEFEKANSTRSKVEILACEKPPSPRVNFTFVAHPAKDELLLFGGEFFNGMRALCEAFACAAILRLDVMCCC